METLEQQQRMQMHEGKLVQTITDAQFWLDKYTESFKAHDKTFNGIKEELSGRMDNLH